MEKIKKNIDWYVAADGEGFATERECLEHEHGLTLKKQAVFDEYQRTLQKVNQQKDGLLRMAFTAYLNAKSDWLKECKARRPCRQAWLQNRENALHRYHSAYTLYTHSLCDYFKLRYKLNKLGVEVFGVDKYGRRRKEKA